MLKKMKRQLTAEQEAARKARKEKFGALWKQVAAMPELERVQLAMRLGIVTCEGHELSLCNTMLIALQNPTASIVGGFRQWLKHGRHALNFVKDGGILVSIVGAGPKQRAAFQGKWFNIPVGAFSEEGTEVATQIVIIDC